MVSGLELLVSYFSKFGPFVLCCFELIRRVHRARSAGMGHPGNTYSKSNNGRKGKVPMVKKVRRKTGVVFNTALIAAGWLTFIVGQVIPDLFVKSVLLSIARVLPYEFSLIVYPSRGTHG